MKRSTKLAPFTLFRGAARPCFAATTRYFLRLVRSCQFASPLCGPAGFIGLTASRDSQGVRGNVVGDRGARGDIGAIADSHGGNQRGVTSDKNFVADVRIAEIGEVHRLGAFADSALLQLDEISDARIRFQVIVRAKAREGTDDDAVVEAALRHDTMRLDGYVVAKSRVGENASRSNGAAHPNFCLAEQLHAGFDDRVFTRDDLRIDHHRFRQLNGYAGLHQRAALPFAEDAVDFGEVRSRVATENFARIRG